MKEKLKEKIKNKNTDRMIQNNTKEHEERKKRNILKIDELPKQREHEQHPKRRLYAQEESWH